MIPKDRIKLYAQLSAAGAIVIWAVLCFAILVAPRIRGLRRAEGELATSNKQLQEMRKEIENASIIGQPAPGQSRYEKFGILGADEEQLFLSDLIGFCKETRNTLNLVRRADNARPASQSAEPVPQKTGPTGRPVQPKPSEQAKGQPGAPTPVIERVPHTVSFSGTFLSSFLLLRKLESYKRLMTVERVEVATDSQAGWPHVNGNITLDLFLVKNPGQPTGTQAEGATASGASAAGKPAASGATKTPGEGESQS
ncbi:MAG: hypothetical protein ACE149_04355 [Armatimonadota bacterium]